MGQKILEFLDAHRAHSTSPPLVAMVATLVLRSNSDRFYKIFNEPLTTRWWLLTHLEWQKDHPAARCRETAYLKLSQQFHRLSLLLSRGIAVAQSSAAVSRTLPIQRNIQTLRRSPMKRTLRSITVALV